MYSNSFAVSFLKIGYSFTFDSTIERKVFTVSGALYISNKWPISILCFCWSSTKFGKYFIWLKIKEISSKCLFPSFPSIPAHNNSVRFPQGIESAINVNIPINTTPKIINITTTIETTKITPDKDSEGNNIIYIETITNKKVISVKVNGTEIKDKDSQGRYYFKPTQNGKYKITD